MNLPANGGDMGSIPGLESNYNKCTTYILPVSNI